MIFKAPFILFGLFQYCRFGRSFVHREIGKLVNQYLEGPWISFKEIPKENIEPLWVRFKVIY